VYLIVIVAFIYKTIIVFQKIIFCDTVFALSFLHFLRRLEKSAHRLWW